MADAHVTVNPGEAPKGGFAKLAFRVPTERDDAGTTAATQDDVDSANLLGIVGIVVGALGLLVGGIALFRRRSA